MSFDDVFKIVSNGGAIGTLILFFFSIRLGWFVPGQIYKDLRNDRDTWRDLTMQSTLTTKEATQTAVQLFADRKRTRDSD